VARMGTHASGSSDVRVFVNANIGSPPETRDGPQFIAMERARPGESARATSCSNSLCSRRIAPATTGIPDTSLSIFNIDSSWQAAASSTSETTMTKSGGHPLKNTAIAKNSALMTLG